MSSQTGAIVAVALALVVSATGQEWRSCAACSDNEDWSSPHTTDSGWVAYCSWFTGPPNGCLFREDPDGLPYSSAQMAEVRDNCPVSCGLCALDACSGGQNAGCGCHRVKGQAWTPSLAVPHPLGVCDSNGACLDWSAVACKRDYNLLSEDRPAGAECYRRPDTTSALAEQDYAAKGLPGVCVPVDENGDMAEKMRCSPIEYGACLDKQVGDKCSYPIAGTGGVYRECYRPGSGEDLSKALRLVCREIISTQCEGRSDGSSCEVPYRGASGYRSGEKQFAGYAGSEGFYEDDEFYEANKISVHYTKSVCMGCF